MLETLYRIERIERVDNTHVTAAIVLDSGHDIFRGHFPNMPILPGVCMIRIIQDTLSTALQQRLRLIHASSIKFLAVIDPRVDVTLQVDASLFLHDGDTIEVKATLSNTDRVFMRFHGVFADLSTTHRDVP